MKFLYTLSFLLGADNWQLESLPNEITEALADFDKGTTQVLDLGCGVGKESVALAAQGWKVIGVDFIPLAIRRARKAAAKAGVNDLAQFYSADVSDLSTLQLPPVQFAYDIGCFHLLEPDKRESYIAGLDGVMESGGLFLLHAFTPRQQGKKVVGLEPDAIEELFSPSFKLEKVSDHSYWRFPANWYWLRKM
jgi:cyclopropane fatty-acyl-phospholipid synthase-like methyltransferase